MALLILLASYIPLDIWLLGGALMVALILMDAT